MNTLKTESKKEEKRQATQEKPSLEFKPARGEESTNQRGFMTLSYTAAVLCVLVGGVYVYTSQAAKEPSYPTPISEDLLRPVTVPVKEEEPVVEPTPALDLAEPQFRPTAIIDVPGVGLRSTPDIAAKNRPGIIKRGEGVEIIGRSSSTGPDWVKIKTRSGKVGWVFASVVRERKGR